MVLWSTQRSIPTVLLIGAFELGARSIVSPAGDEEQSVSGLGGMPACTLLTTFPRHEPDSGWDVNSMVRVPGLTSHLLAWSSGSVTGEALTVPTF